jgi:S1-C subfamily serine protease
LNASVHLLRTAVAATTHLRVDVPDDHPSAGVLGQERMATGVVLAPSGVILTAHYALIGAVDVEVSFPEGPRRMGRVAGVDYASGIGAVVIDEPAPASLRARSDGDLTLGEEVFVIASVADGRRVSCGAVSTIGPFDAFWEYLVERALTATADTPGLSGGPVIDARGRLAAIATLSVLEVGKFTLAIPVSYALPMVDAIVRQGSYAAPSPRAWLGITCTPMGGHVVIAGVVPGSPAEQAGLRSGDVLLAIDGEAVSDRATLYTRLWQRAPGQPAKLRVMREGGAVDLAALTTSIEDFFRPPSP